jgi:hypothetical protein
MPSLPRTVLFLVVCFSGVAAAKEKVVLFSSDVPVSHWGIWLLNPLPVGLFSPF